MRQAVVVEGAAARLQGWVDGAGPPVLLLHGGPGLGFECLDAIVVMQMERARCPAECLPDGLTRAAPEEVEEPADLSA